MIDFYFLAQHNTCTALLSHSHKIEQNSPFFFIVHFLVVLSASYLFPSLQVQEKSLQYKDNARDIFGKICYEKMKWVVVVVWRLQRSRNLKIPAFCQEKLNVKQLKLRNLS